MVGAVLLLLGGVVFSPQLNGTRRWFFLAGLSLQPSELAKLALVPFLAYQLDKKPGEVNRLSLLLPVGAATLLVSGLILLEPDMGTAVLLTATTLMLLFLAGLSWRWLAGALALVPPVLWLLVMAEPYRRGPLFPPPYPQPGPPRNTFPTAPPARAAAPPPPLRPHARPTRQATTFT